METGLFGPQCAVPIGSWPRNSLNARNTLSHTALPSRSPLSGGPRTYARRFPERYERLVGAVAKEAFNDVIPRFHMVDGKPVAPARYSATKAGLSIKPKARVFLNENGNALDLLAIGAWVRFTERHTSAPRLFEKIRGLKPRRSSLKPYSEFSARGKKVVCLYCAEPEPDLVVDHVVPWRFVAEDKVWNLVLACRGCNSAKSNRIPTGAHIARLLEINEELLRLDPDRLPPRVRRDLEEWRTGGISDHVLGLVQRCHADGFQTWEV